MHVRTLYGHRTFDVPDGMTAEALKNLINSALKPGCSVHRMLANGYDINSTRMYHASVATLAKRSTSLMLNVSLMGPDCGSGTTDRFDPWRSRQDMARKRWKSVRSLSKLNAALASWNAEAAQRTYAPGGAGYEEARSTFRHGAEQQERSNAPRA